MATLVFHDPAALLHDTGPGHPERIERITTVMGQIQTAGRAVRLPADFGWDSEPNLRATVLNLHTAEYVQRIESAIRAHARYLDCIDSAICPQSLQAAYSAVGCALAATDAVMSGRCTNAFSAMRPPGHHAEADHSMGFCLFNNVALAAEHLIRRHGLQRIAIVDFDVHHGNGTQHLFESRGDVYYVSLHEHPSTCYPGTGFEWERGTRGTPGEGRTLNVPLWAGTGDAEALRACAELVVPELEAYRPEFVLISAGFDADARDPLADLRWTPRAFEEITRMLAGVAGRHAQGRIVSVLEGGYDLAALSEGVDAHLTALCDA